MPRSKIILLLAFLTTGTMLKAQNTFQPNYDESAVPEYTLPDPLVDADGDRIRYRRQWSDRREELLELFAVKMYGKSPDPLPGMHFRIRGMDPDALDGKALRKQVRVYFSDDPEGPSMDLLLYLPARRSGRVPVFLGLNFYGNQTVHSDPGIALPEGWVANNEEFGITQNRATEASRGVRVGRWPVERILERGYGLVTAYYGDITPDRDSAFREGVHSLYLREGQQFPRDDEWGAIAAWAWGLQRAMDYLAYDPDIDESRVAVMGHSRLGKAALWAGVQDERFALVISNDSGCGGAALSRRRFGETIARITTAFPHWFCRNFEAFADNEDQLPFDQHQLIALVAPRPVYVASAEDDLWADPKGEFLAAREAGKVYEFLGLEGLTASSMPEVEKPVMSRVGYHIRKGKHDVTNYDWEQWLDFADVHMR